MKTWTNFKVLSLLCKHPRALLPPLSPSLDQATLTSLLFLQQTYDPRAFALAVPSVRTTPPQASPGGPLLHSGMASPDHPPKPTAVTPTPSFPKELVTPHIIVNTMCLSGLPHPLGLCSRTWSLRPLLRLQAPRQRWALELIRGFGWSGWCLFLLGNEGQWAWGTRGPVMTSFLLLREDLSYWTTG